MDQLDPNFSEKYVGDIAPVRMRDANSAQDHCQHHDCFHFRSVFPSPACFCAVNMGDGVSNDPRLHRTGFAVATCAKNVETSKLIDAEVAWADLGVITTMWVRID